MESTHQRKQNCLDPQEQKPLQMLERSLNAAQTLQNTIKTKIEGVAVQLRFFKEDQDRLLAIKTTNPEAFK